MHGMNKQVLAKLKQTVATAEQRVGAEFLVVVRSRPLWSKLLRMTLLSASREAYAARVYQAAERYFYRQGFNNTKARNAVMLYVDLSSRVSVIYADEAAYRILGESTCQAMSALIADYAKKAQLFEGVECAIMQLAQQLEPHFPRVRDSENQFVDDLQVDEMVMDDPT